MQRRPMRLAKQVTDQKEDVTVVEAGKRGGRATLENRGRGFFRKIGRKGGRRTAKLYSDLLKEFGKRGGRPKRPPLSEFVGGEDHQ